MSVGGLNSADTSRPSARHAVALGLVLLSVTVAGAALGGVTAAESQSSPVEISDWTDLQAINDSQATLSDDYVLVNDLNKSTAGYNAVVLNQTATEFTEEVRFESGESRVNLTRTPVAELLSNDGGLNLTVVDSANGTIEREDTSSFSFPSVSYTTPTERFVGFSPIGPSFSEPFSGSFDGQGNTIRDLLIERSADSNVGLFGFSEGTIEQVTLANATITGSDYVGGLVGFKTEGTVSNSSASGAVTGSQFVGGLVGANDGTVSNSSASGAVTGSNIVGGLVNIVGGLVGSNDGTVSNSSASGAVTGSSRVGGLVGFNDDGTVSNSSASGAVDGSRSVGGLVGQNAYATVSNSSASGAVTGSFSVGGLVGWNFEGTVSESFATGAVTGSVDMGGLVGLLGFSVLEPGEEAILRDSYYDNQTTGQQAAVGTIEEGGGTAELRGEVTGFPTSQMQGASAAQNMGALDFTSTWRVVTNPPGYPELRGLPGGPDPSLTAVFTITPEDPTAGEQLILDAGPSTPESDIEGYNWTLGDGTTATGKQITHTYTDSGQFTVELTVQNGTETDTATKTVTPSDGPPLTAAFNVTPEDPTAGEQLTLDADPSTPESNIESYNWTLGDGTTATGKQINHTYTNFGQFTVELTVQNGTETDTATETVSVSAPSSPVEISDWTDLEYIRDNLDADYVLVNDLNKSTAGYNAVVLNQTATEFTETVSFDFGESRVNLTRTPVAELLSNNEGLNLTVVDSANGTIEREDTSSVSNVAVSYTTSTERFVGFSPIGPSSSEPFTGSFDGQGNTIRGLLIDRPAELSIGVFGASEGTIEQVTVANATITGSNDIGGLVGQNRGGFEVSEGTIEQVTVANATITGSNDIGGLVGQNRGTVSNSSASGAVNGSDTVGGLVGRNSFNTVNNSSASGGVNGSDDVGGLVGANLQGTVSNSSASGAVTGSGFDAGGLVGQNGGTVSNSSASGNVTGSSTVGGLVGYNFDGTVSESFATGVVTGSSNVGGLVASGGSVNGSYWDIQATGQSQSAGGTGLNTSQMQGASAAQNMGALDFTNTWRVVTNPPGYPELRRLPDGSDPEPPLTAGFTITPEDPIVGEQLTFDADPSTPESDIESYDWTLGDGTTATGKQVTHTYTNSGQFTVELTVQNGTKTDTATETVSVSPPSSSVEISDWSDLDDIRNDTDADYVLVNDLNKSTAGYNAVVLNQTATEFTEEVRFNPGESRVNLTRTPVAELLSNDGGLNLTVVDSANGTIEREDTSSFSDVDVTYNTSTERFVGFSPIGPSFSEPFSGSFDGQGNTIRDLLTERSADSNVGLFGFSEGTIEQVTLANATITGSQFVGGLVGWNFEGTVSNSSASGAVDGSQFVGGLVGANDGTVSNSSASGAVTGSNIVGGLVGANDGTVSNSSASGAVTGSSRVGGLVGFNNEGTVSNSSASGAVDGSRSVGGLVGVNGGDVSTSSASGAVNGSEDVGGLVGDNGGTVSTSSASGAVNGSKEVGGLVGGNGGDVNNSSASGAVTGSNEVGGLVGGNFKGTVSESFATGAVTGSSNVGGLVGKLGYDSLNPGEEAILRDSYYDNQTTGQQAAVGTIVEGNGTAELRGEVAGLATSQMQGASAAQNMEALDFTNTWQVVTNPPGYPELRSLSGGPDPSLTAAFTVTPENPTVGEQLTLNADPSIPESDIESYDWTLGDGTTATGKQVTHTYTDSGQFTVELTVQNSTETDTATETVSVSPPSSFEVSDLTAPAQATLGTTIDVNATITNTGGAADTQAVAFVFDGTTVANMTVELNASESTSVAFSPTVPDSPGTYEHGVFTDDDNKTAQITVGESGPPNVMLSSLSIAGQGDNATVTAGSYDVSVELSHDGGPNRTVPMELTIGNATTTETVSLNASESKTVTFENATGGLSPAVYNVTVSAVDASLTGGLTLSVPVGDEPDPASDTDDDGLLEDTDGSGEFTIFDVQTFFVEFQSDPVQTNSALFNFDESGDGEVTIFDVQALFLELAG